MTLFLLLTRIHNRVSGHSLLNSTAINQIELTRRLSGTNAAVIEANTHLAGVGQSPVKLHDGKKYAATKNNEIQLQIEERDFGLGDKEWHLLTVPEIVAELVTDLDKGFPFILYFFLSYTFPHYPLAVATWALTTCDRSHVTNAFLLPM